MSQFIKQTLDELLSQIIEIDSINETHIDKTITVAGWVDFPKKQKKIVFLKLSDSADSRLKQLQVVFEKTDDQESFDSISTIQHGSTIIVKGILVASIGSGQKIELKALQHFILGDISSEPQYYPLAGNVCDLPELLRDIPELECRSQIKSALYKVRSCSMTGLEEFFTKEKYLHVDMPMLTDSECEGGCQPMQATKLLASGKLSDIPIKDGFVDFSKDFFKTKSSITVSAQLELETQLPLGNVWTVTRAVRGEPSQTSKHLCEFSMIELEKRFSRSSVDIMDISERCIKYCISYILANCSVQMEFLDKFYGKDHIKKLLKYVEEPFVRITHADAITMMLDDVKNGLMTFVEMPTYNGDLASEHEKYLLNKYEKPVIVADFPEEIKAFYMPAKDTSHGVTHVDCFDILVPGVGELVGGSQRIHNEAELLKKIDRLGLDRKPLQFYINLRKYGSVPHGGMGMGFERLVAFITGAENVKDCVAFPKYMGCGKSV